MSTVPGCGRCNRPAHDGAELCTTCTTALAEQLRGVPHLVDDLLITLAKQDRLSSGAGKGRHEQPLPLRLDIPEEIWVLGNVVTTWAREIATSAGLRVDARHLGRPILLDLIEETTAARERPVPEEERCALTELPMAMCAHCRGHAAITGLEYTGVTTHHQRRAFVAGGTKGPSALESLKFAAVWLAAAPGALRRSPAAAQAYDELTDAIAKAKRAIDRPPALAFRGPCAKCGKELHALPQAETVRCGMCGESYDGATLRAALLDAAADHLVTAVELSAALTGLAGTAVPIGTIRSWRSRGQLAIRAWLHAGRTVVPRPIDPKDRPMFRVGEAVALLKKHRAS